MEPLQLKSIRYLLPVFPFVCVLIGGVPAMIDTNRKKWALVGLLGWSVLETVFVAPHYLAYFNEFVGGPAHGHKWLVDSNLDWGQDLFKLKGYLEKQPPSEVIIAYFGHANLNYYLGDHLDLFAKPPAPDEAFQRLRRDDRPQLLVISATLLEGEGISDPDILRWLRAKRPQTVIGHSMFVYNITHDRESLINVGKIFLRNKETAAAERQFQKASAERLDGAVGN
jgi:hypothetical protein